MSCKHKKNLLIVALKSPSFIPYNLVLCFWFWISSCAHCDSRHVTLFYYSSFLEANSCFAWQIESELVMTPLLTPVMDRRTEFLHCGTVKKNTKTKKRKEADVVTPRYVDDELQKTVAFKCAVEVVRVRFSQCTFILVYKLSFTMNKTSKLHMHRLLVRGKRQKQRETKLIVAATNNILVRNKLLRMDFTRKRVVDGLY